MKKVLVLFVLTAFSLMAFLSCKTKKDSGFVSFEEVTGEYVENYLMEEVLKHDEYDEELYLKPYWKGGMMYNETCLAVGETDSMPLLHDAEEIISVTSYDLKTTYEEGKDYLFDHKSNSIKRLAGSRMPYYSLYEYYPKSGESNAFSCARSDKDFILFGEGDTMTSHQIAVTYRFSRYHVLAPKSSVEATSNTRTKLENNEEMTLLFYGDSITVGANSSGFIGVEPNAPIYPQMVFNAITKKYGATTARYVNTAVGGWSSQHGVDSFTSCVLNYHPDMLFLAFGMNDGGLGLVKHVENTKQMIETAWEQNPDMDICLIATMLPNQEVTNFFTFQNQILGRYESLVEEYAETGKTNMCIAPVTTIHEQMLGRKRYFDMTGNNVNHPNDFFARAYAQTILKSAFGIE